MYRPLLTAVLVLTAALAINGCKKNPVSIDSGPTETPVVDNGRVNDSYSTGELPTDVIIDNLTFRHDADIWPVYFDLDSYTIRASEFASLEHNAGVLNQRTGYIQVAGHCDERGTQEYNLALGERRALAVRDHLIRLGVDSSRILTTSYGEEQPASSGTSEEAWALNRRAETLVAN